MALIKCPDCGKDVSDSAEACPSCSRPIKPAKKSGGGGLSGCGCLMIGAVLFFGYCSMQMSNLPTARPTAAPAVQGPTPETAGLRTDVSKDIAVDANWSPGGFGAVALWKLKLTNKSAKWTFADLRYRTIYDGESGARLRTNRGTLAIVLKPKEVRVIKEFNDGLLPAQTHMAGFTVYAAEAR